MKALMLDFDGVLNYAEWIYNLDRTGDTSLLQRHRKELDPSRVKMISDLAVETNTIIVVSSSWRIIHELHELQECLESNGMDPRVLPKHMTPTSRSGYRGEEVKAWIDANPYILNYVIFDDNSDFYPHQPLVKTTWEEGLLPEHIEEARKILLNIE